MARILPYMMYLTFLVKILLPVMDLNIFYKTYKTSKNTRNSDLPKNRKIWFSVRKDHEHEDLCVQQLALMLRQHEGQDDG